MKEKYTTTIKIRITSIKVTNDGYYAIRFESIIDGKTKKHYYSSDYEGQTAKQFEKVLRKGYAVELALEQIL